MLNSIKNRKDLEKTEELASLQNQVEEVRLQDKLGKRNLHENMKKIYEPLTDTNKNTSEKLTKTLTESSIKNNQALENQNDKFLQMMKDRGLIASYLFSPLSKITDPEKKLVNSI